MGFSFGSFLGGVAGGISENMDKYEKEAAKAAEIQVNLMSKNFMDRKGELETLRNTSIGDAKLVTGVWGNVEGDNPMFEDMVFAATQDPAAMKMIKEAVAQPWFDPKKHTLSSIVKPLQQEASGQTALDRIRNQFSIDQAVQNVKDLNLTAKQEGSKNPFKEIAVGEADIKAQRALSSVAKALGTTPEQMAGAMKYERPIAPTTARFDYTSLKAPMSWNDTKNMALNGLAAAKAEQDNVNKDPNATQDQKDQANQAVRIAEGQIKNIRSIDETLSSDQVQWANKLAAAKNVLTSRDATPEQKAEAQSVVSKARTMDQTASQRLQDQIAGLVLTASNSKDPEKVKAANEQLNKIYTAENKKIQGSGMVTFDQFRKLINDRIKNDLESRGAIINNVQFGIDGTATFKGDPQFLNQFNMIKQNAVRAIGAQYADPEGRMFNPIYGSILDTYQVPKNASGQYNFNPVTEPANAGANTPATPAVPAKPTGFTVTDPTGKIHTFPTQQAADAFKKAIES